MLRLDRPLLTATLLAFAWSGSFPVLAQDYLDSLRGVYADPDRSDSIRFSAFNDLAWEGYLFSEPDTAFAMGQRLQREAKSKRYPAFEARASELMAAACYVKGELKTALVHYDTALIIHERSNDQKGVADVLTNKASMLSFMGEREQALQLYLRGLAVHEKMHDSTSIANDLNAIGAVHMARGDHARAVDFYMRSLRLQQLLRNDRGISTTRSNLGKVLMQQGDHVPALEHYREALRLAEALDDQHMVGKGLEDIGVCLEELGDTASAMDHFLRSRSVRQTLDDRHGLVNVQNRIGMLLLKLRRDDEALDLFREAAAMAREEELPWGLSSALVGEGKVLLSRGAHAQALDRADKAFVAATDAEDISQQRDAAELKYQALRALGRWEQALQAQSLMVSLKDSIMREENQRAVLRNEYRYAYEQRTITDSLQYALEAEQAALEQEQRFSRERTKRYIAIALGILAAIILVVFWQRARLLRRTNAAILDAQTKLVESEKRREAEEVRTRIARDVHDQLGSDLTKLVMLSSEAKALASEDPGAIAATADDIERVAGEANRSLGDIVWAIDPHHDSLAGLTERVRAHCERMLKWSHTEHTIDCVHSGPDHTLDPATKRDIYLILREALNNAIKYAHARHIAVTFHSSASNVDFTVTDDGIGLDPGSASAGHGLSNMRQRALNTGGELLVNGSNGTTISFHLAL